MFVVDRCLWIGACESASFNRGGLVLGLTSDREWKEEFQMGNGERERERGFEINNKKVRKMIS